MEKALDDVHFGAFHLIQELAGVSGKGFDVAALAFGVDGIEGKGDLPEPERPVMTVREFPGDFDVDIP